MKRVIAIHDLSCYAKASLTIVVPTLSAMGIEVAVLPTALLSTHTGGFDSYFYQDLTDSMEQILAHWKRLDLRFDAIYSGFLGSSQQLEIVRDCISWQRRLGDPLVLVDPVLGDDGSPYGPVEGSLIEGMSGLASCADVVTPNVTEAALLLGEPYREALSLDEAAMQARRISEKGPSKVAITGILRDGGGAVVCYDKALGASSSVYRPYAPISYPGTGDLFASILCGLLLKGEQFFDAAAQSASRVSQAVFASLQCGIERRHGVAVELLASSLAGEDA